MAIVFALAGTFCFGAVAVAMAAGLARTRDAAAGVGIVTVVVSVVATAIAAVSVPDASDLALGDLWPFLIAGVLVPGGAQIFFMRAVRDLGASRASVVVGAGPVLASLLAIVVLDEPLRVVVVVATGLIVCGVIVLTSGGAQARPSGYRPIGFVFVVGSVAVSAAYQVLTRWAFTRAQPDPFVASAAAACVAAIVGGGYAVVTSGPRATLRALPAFWPAGVGLALGLGALLLALERGKVTVIVPLTATQSLVAVALAAIVFGRSEMINRRLVTAALLVVAGAVLIGATR